MRAVPHSASLCLAALSLLGLLEPAARADDLRKKQQIDFAELPAHSITDAPFELSAKASSGLPVSFELISGPAVLDGKKLKLTGVSGLVIVRAAQAGNALYAPAVAAERAFAVNGRPVVPTIRLQPAAAMGAVGEMVTLTVAAVGDPLPDLQWRKDGEPISGATRSTLTIPSASPADAGSYDVVASNPAGTVTSERVRVAVGKRSQTINFLTPPSISAGQPVSLNVSASSGLPVQLTVVSGLAILSGMVLTAQSGSVVVQATQPGDLSYDPASPATQTFFVTGPMQGQHSP